MRRVVLACFDPQWPSLKSVVACFQFSYKCPQSKNSILKAHWYAFNGGSVIEGAKAMSKFVAFLKNESGATAIEYGLIAAGISVAIIAVVNGLGTQLSTTFGKVTDAMAAHN
jgi:pilus assembly protein Flp/PilA